MKGQLSLRTESPVFDMNPGLAHGIQCRRVHIRTAPRGLRTSGHQWALNYLADSFSVGQRLRVMGSTVPPKRYTQVLTPGTCDVAYLEIGLCRCTQVRMRSYWSRMGSDPT